jgi:hypothetical protein
MALAVILAVFGGLGAGTASFVLFSCPCLGMPLVPMQYREPVQKPADIPGIPLPPEPPGDAGTPKDPER